MDAELFRLDAVVRWLDAADGRIKRAAVEPSGRCACPIPKGAAKGDGTAMSVLELREVSKAYGDGLAEVHALRDVS